MAKSITWHQEKLLARLHPNKHKQKVWFEEHYVTDRNRTMVIVWITDTANINRPVAHLIQGSIQPHLTNRVIQALYKLINTGKLKASISNHEWPIQTALGAAEKRCIRISTP
jgi:rRNA-processing protein FCF1